MADDFSSGATFGDNPLRQAREMSDAFANAQSAVNQIQRALRGSDTSAENIRLSFSRLTTSADRVAEIQQQTEKSTRGTLDAIKQANFALSESRRLAVAAERIYEESKKTTGVTADNLRKLAETTVDAASAARDLADIYNRLATKSAEYDENTKKFADRAEVFRKIAPSLARPYEEAAIKAREIAVQNAKIAAHNENIRQHNERANELLGYSVAGSVGLTREKIKELGLEEKLLDKNNKLLSGTAAIKAARKRGLLDQKKELDLIDSSKLGIEAIGKQLSSKGFQLGLAIAAFKGLLKIILQIDEQITKLAKSTGMSYREAQAYREEIQSAGIYNTDLVNTTKNLLNAQYELAKVAGATRGFKVEELKAQAALTTRVGMQAESAAKLAVLSRLQGQSAEKALDDTVKQTASLLTQTGIQLDNREILDEVANTQGRLAANYKNAPNLIAAAVVQTRRLGLTLAQAASASEKLLDFESSIEAELEAELLTGRSLNLERARALALQGKSAEAAAELAKNFGSLEEFQGMSVIAQNALAKAVGMTADELANSLVQQRNLNLLGAETRKQIEDRVNKLRQQGKVEEANRLLSQAANEQDAKAALMRLSSQEKLNLLMDKMVDFFVSLIDNHMPVLLGILGAIAGVMAGIATSVAIATGGLALVGAGIGAAVGIGAGFAIPQMQDGMIDPDGGLIVSGRKGSIQLDKDDSIIAGTNLGGNGNSELIKKIDRLIEVVEKGGNVYLDSNKVGYSLALASTKQ